MPNDASDGKRVGAGAVFRTYWRAMRGYPWSIAIIFISAFAMQAANLASPLYLRQFFNVLSGGRPTPATFNELVYLIVMVAIFLLFNWIMTRVQSLTNMYMQSRVMRDLYAQAFEYLMGHSYTFFISRFAGSLTHKVNKFARGFEILLDAIVLQFFPTFLFVAGAVVILSLHNLVLGAMLGVWAVLFIIFQIVLARRRQPLRAERSEADSRVTGALADAISNQSAITLFSGKKHEQGLFGNIVELWHEATLRVWYADEWIWAALGLFFVVINIGLLYGAVIFWQRGELTVGDFVLIQSYLLTAFNQLLGINRELRRFHDAYADAGELVYMLEMPHEIRDVSGAQPLHVTSGAIAFENVGFYFRDVKAPILRDFQLDISGGQKVALVGPSGAGKSTITRLLLRFYDIKSGRIVIDGQNIVQVTQGSLRDAISYVPQEPVLFHRSLLENIRYGRLDATDEEIFEAARKAHCHEFIEGLPERYGTFVGERGVKLSGGERQRVAIARAILKDSPILVLDEATSSLDSESESLIQDALATLMQGKTVIVIAHRLSTIMKMDRIIVLESGTIVADGTHDELLKSGGLYQKLWSIQAGGFMSDMTEDIDMEDESDDDAKATPQHLQMK
jgi:ATP-binding cassette subfamily B protein